MKSFILALLLTVAAGAAHAEPSANADFSSTNPVLTEKMIKASLSQMKGQSYRDFQFLTTIVSAPSKTKPPIYRIGYIPGEVVIYISMFVPASTKTPLLAWETRIQKFPSKNTGSQMTKTLLMIDCHKSTIRPTNVIDYDDNNELGNTSLAGVGDMPITKGQIDAYQLDSMCQQGPLDMVDNPRADAKRIFGQ